jgi:hypothetical protein
MKHMKLHESFFEGIARVCLTTENTESTEFFEGAGLAANLLRPPSGRNDECKSTARLFHAKARRREGWRASVPTSRLPLSGRMGGTSVARPQASRRLPLPALRKPDDTRWRAASGWRTKLNWVAGSAKKEFLIS